MHLEKIINYGTSEPLITATPTDPQSDNNKNSRNDNKSRITAIIALHEFFKAESFKASAEGNTIRTAFRLILEQNN